MEIQPNIVVASDSPSGGADTTSSDSGDLILNESVPTGEQLPSDNAVPSDTQLASETPILTSGDIVGDIPIPTPNPYRQAWTDFVAAIDKIEGDWGELGTAAKEVQDSANLNTAAQAPPAVAPPNWSSAITPEATSVPSSGPTTVPTFEFGLPDNVQPASIEELQVPDVLPTDDIGLDTVSNESNASPYTGVDEFGAPTLEPNPIEPIAPIEPTG